jgi:hypothetical protein
MSRGIVIFAQNNSDIDYARMSIFAAKRAKKFLDVPVSLITDSTEWLLTSQPDAKEVFDQIISIWTPEHQYKTFHDGTLSSKQLEWKNFSRSKCYELSPYDETIVIDSDYIINSDILSSAWGSDTEFLIYKIGNDLAGWRDDSSFKFINQFSIPFYWATAFYFKKTQTTDSFFRFVEHIKQNWLYYKNLYCIDSSIYRNDFAFSIALHAFGEDFFTTLPGKLNYILDRDVLLETNDVSMKFLIEKENYAGEFTLIKTSGLDVHVMNKYSLMRIIEGSLDNA